MTGAARKPGEWLDRQDYDGAMPRGNRANAAANYLKLLDARGHRIGGWIDEVIASLPETSEADFAAMWATAPVPAGTVKLDQWCCGTVPALARMPYNPVAAGLAVAPEVAALWAPPAVPDPIPYANWQHPVAARLAALKAAALTTATLDRVEAVTPLVDGWLYLDTLAWGKGKRGGGKTVMAVDMAGCAGTGMSWHAHAVRQGPVLYLALESMPGVRQRARAWEALNGRPMTGVTFSTARLSLMDRTDAGAVAAWARELGAVLVVVDTQARATPGAEENSNRDMGLFVAALDGIREACGGCVLVLHHMPRDGDNLRGATALEAAASTIIDVSGDGAMVTMRTDDEHGGRQKDAADPVPLALELTAAGPGLALRLPRAAAVLDSMKEGQRKMAATIARASGAESVKVLADMAGLPEMTARRALWDLEERFWAVRSGTAQRQLWVATDLCRQAHQRQPDSSVNGVSIVTGPPDVLESSHSLAPSAPKTAPGETAGQEASHQGAPAPDQPGAPAHHAPHPYRGGAGGCGVVKRGASQPDAPAEDPPGYPAPARLAAEVATIDVEGLNQDQLALIAKLQARQDAQRDGGGHG